MAHLPKNKPGSAQQGLTRRCSRCRGSGMAPCQICGGRGQVASGTLPNGQPTLTTCSGCLGAKTRRCTTCAGQGFVH